MPASKNHHCRPKGPSACLYFGAEDGENGKAEHVGERGLSWVGNASALRLRG